MAGFPAFTATKTMLPDCYWNFARERCSGTIGKMPPLAMFDSHCYPGSFTEYAGALHLASYFSECITSKDLDDRNIEIMRNNLYNAYLEDFYRFCQNLRGAIAEIMSDLLLRLTEGLIIQLLLQPNSIGTELTRDDRKKLYSSFGLL
ncbi:hypothetical protein ABKV19_018288 [Rosa sericea]